jgi:hypothetical protein
MKRARSVKAWAWKESIDGKLYPNLWIVFDKPPQNKMFTERIGGYVPVEIRELPRSKKRGK